MSEVTTGRDGAILTITLNRPQRLNALDKACRAELLAALGDAADTAVRAVVLAGAGRAFCVGQDLSATEELAAADVTVLDTYNPLVRMIRELDKPVVAAVNGPAVGAGMGLALACDLRVMAEDAYLACPFSKVGLVPDTGLSHELVRQLGYARAFQVAAIARPITAVQALEWGLVTHIAPTEAVIGEAVELARQLAKGPGLALALTKRLLTAAAHNRLDTMLRREAFSQGIAAASAEHAAGSAAFRGKHDPCYPDGPLAVPSTVPKDAM